MENKKSKNGVLISGLALIALIVVVWAVMVYSSKNTPNSGESNHPVATDPAQQETLEPGIDTPDREPTSSNDTTSNDKVYYATDYNGVTIVKDADDIENYTSSNNTEVDVPNSNDGVIDEENNEDIVEPDGAGQIVDDQPMISEEELKNNAYIDPTAPIKMEARVEGEDGRSWIVPYFFDNHGNIVNSDGMIINIENLTNDRGQIVYGDKLLTKDNIIIKNPEYVPYKENYTYVEQKYDADGMLVGEETHTVEHDNSKATSVIYNSPHIYEHYNLASVIGGEGWGFYYAGIGDGFVRFITKADNNETVITLELQNPDGTYTNYVKVGSTEMLIPEKDFNKSVGATLYVEFFKNGEFDHSESYMNIYIPVGG